MGIHYDYKSKRGERAMLKEEKRKERLALCELDEMVEGLLLARKGEQLAELEAAGGAV